MGPTKICHKCWMEIPLGASKCPYCHEDLTSGGLQGKARKNAWGCIRIMCVMTTIGSWIWAACESGVMTNVLIVFGIVFILIAWLCFYARKHDL